MSYGDEVDFPPIGVPLFLGMHGGGPAPGQAFWILWNPSSDRPPRVRFGSLKEAQDVAQLMARKHAPHRFFVCRAETSAVVPPPPVELTPLEAPCSGMDNGAFARVADILASPKKPKAKRKGGKRRGR